MKTQAYLPLNNNPATSIFPLLLLALLTLSFCVFGMGLLAYSTKVNTTAPVVVQAPTPAPICFDHSREFIAAHGAPEGCPTDSMAYRPAALFRVQPQG